MSICSHISCSVAFVATSINQSGILLIRKVNKCDFMSSSQRAIALLCLQIDIKNVAKSLQSQRYQCLYLPFLWARIMGGHYDYNIKCLDYKTFDLDLGLTNAV